jgi:hypothetical protein
MAREYRTGSAPTFGMRGTGSWTESEMPDSYREGILFLYPNGAAPLTALMAKMGSQKEDVPYFRWFTKGLAPQGCAAPDTTGKIFTTESRGTAYTAGTATAGTTLVVNLTAELSKLTRPGMELLLRKSNDHSGDVVARVTNVTRGADATSYATVVLLQDDKGAGVTGAKDVDRVLIVGNINPEGGTRPASMSTNAVELDNNMQIFRNSLSETRTSMQSKKRIGDSYAEMKREAMEQHSIQMEDAFIWGVKSVRTGDNGQPERTTQGIVNILREQAPSNIIDAARITAYSGKEFYEFGDELIKLLIKQVFDYGTSSERLVLLGNSAMLAVQNVVTDNANYNITKGEIGYGIKVMTLTTAFGELHLKTSPRFTIEDSTSRSILIIDPKDAKYHYLQDTMFMQDTHFGKGGGSGKDGKEEEFLTEAGLAYHHPLKAMYISNFGLDSLV